jgi:hypothetical protein
MVKKKKVNDLQRREGIFVPLVPFCGSVYVEPLKREIA